jgi:hypothetical protein
MNTIIFVGEEEESLYLFKNIQKFEQVRVIGIISKSECSPAARQAFKKRIPIYKTLDEGPMDQVELIIDARSLLESEQNIAQKNDFIPVIPCQVVHWVVSLMDEKEQLIKALKEQADIQSFILNLTHDGMIAIDANEVAKKMRLGNTSERLFLRRNCHEFFKHLRLKFTKNKISWMIKKLLPRVFLSPIKIVSF